MALLAAMTLCFAPASKVSAVGSTPSLADLTGTWRLVETSGARMKYNLTIMMNGPVALIVNENGYVSFGIVLPNSGAESAFNIIWIQRYSFESTGGRKKYNAAVLFEDCIYAGIPYVFPRSMEGTISYSPLTGIEDTSFIAIKQNKLSVRITPDDAGSIVSSDSHINTDNSSTEALYDAACPPEQFTLSAKPKTGYSFKHWKAGLTETLTSNPLPVAMFENMNITAVFEKESSGGGSCCFYQCRDESLTTNKGAGYLASDLNTCMGYAEDQCSELGVFPAKYGIVNCPDCSSAACFAKWENMWQ